MSEFETDTIKPSSREKKTVDASRRKLTAAMLAGPVVLSTLASKQALGQDFPYRCTVSGQISILNTDSVRPDGQPCNTFGQPPSYWNEHINCWEMLACTSFSSIFKSSLITTRMGALINEECSAGDVADVDLVRAAIASYLNATYFDYPVSQAQIVDLFQSPPDGLDLLTYFQSLYSSLGPALDGDECAEAVDPPECNSWDGFCTASTAPVAPVAPVAGKKKEK